MYTVYVLYSSEHDKIYIGYTSDMANRFLSHNELSNKGWTIKYRPWVIVYNELFDQKGEAIKREKQLKTATGRKFIREQIIAKLSS
jgi:putative endonuclease